MNDEITFEGYTNNKLRQTKLFGGGIVESDASLEQHNELSVRFCSKNRHKMCDKNKQCYFAKPRCVHDELIMVDKGSWRNLTKEDDKKIVRKLEKLYKKCVRVSVHVSTLNAMV